MSRPANAARAPLHFSALIGSNLAEGDMRARAVYAYTFVLLLAMFCMQIWLSAPDTLPVLAGLGMGGKIALALSLLLAGFALHGAGQVVHGRPTWLAHAAFLITGEWLLLTGTLASVFGLGLCLLALAVSLRRLRRWNPGAFVFVAILALLAAYVHSPSFIALAVTLVILSSLESLRAGRILRSHVSVILPLAFGGIVILIQAAPGDVFAQPAPAALIGSGHRALDTAMLACIVAAVAVVAACAAEVRAFFTLLLAAALILALGLLGGPHAGRWFFPPAAILALLAFQITIARQHGALALGLFGFAILVRGVAALAMAPQ